MEGEFKKNVRFFKLSYSGALLEVETETNQNKLELFNINNIIAVHIKDQKRMYIWVGKQSTQSLQFYISKIRFILSREYSDLVTLRYIYTDSGAEGLDFFDSTGLSKNELHEQLKFQEKLLSPKVSEISDLKNMADEYFMAEDYEKVIDISQKLIELAYEIGDEGLKKDQKEFINEAQLRMNLKKLMKSAEQESEEINQAFLELVTSEKIIAAHELIENFKLKYKDIELTSIPEIDEILSKEQKIWKAFLIAQDEILGEIEVLEKKILSCIEKQEINEAEEHLHTGKNLLKNVMDETIQNKWRDIEQIFLKSRADHDELIQNSKNIIQKLQESFIRYEESNQIELLIETCQSIIMHSKIIKSDSLTEKYSRILKESLEKKRLKTLQFVIDKLRKESKIRLLEGDLVESLNNYDRIISQLKDFMDG